MNLRLARVVPRSAPVVLAVLLVFAIIAFVAVSHLVNRYNANQRSRGRRLYAQGLADVAGGKLADAIEDFRAALTCEPGNSQYQLSLGRVLRDTGNLDEAESYLLALWERNPQDGPINLALGRVAARRGSLDDALRYYHNTIYGVWNADSEANRRKARVELVEFLLQKGANADARSELVALAGSLPAEAAPHLQAAQLFGEAQDYEDALSEYEHVLNIDRADVSAMQGAGEAAFRLGRYRTALRYLQDAVNSGTADAGSRQLLQLATLVLRSDPLGPRVSDRERGRRIAAAFATVGDRLVSCAQAQGVSLKPDTSVTGSAAVSSQSALVQLEGRWLDMKPKLARTTRQEADMTDQVLDLVQQIEDETAQTCGQPQGMDLALLLISRNREAGDR